MERLTIPSNANPIAVAQAFSAHPEVEAAQPNFIRQPVTFESPNDTYYGYLWGLTRISASVAWSAFGPGSDTVVVADIDTGVDYNHPDLAASMWRNPGEIAGNGVDDDLNGYVDDVHGIDAANDDSDPADDHWHGTHTAGTFGAVSDNGYGVTGITNRAQILACKFLTPNGGTDADAIECFNYVVAMKHRGVNIRVTSNSWGAARRGFFPSALKNAIDAAGNAGIVNVFAAGNDGVNIDVTPFDPASFTSPSIVSVAASDSNDARAGFSNYGAVSVDLAAPGVDTLSTYPGAGFAWASGTSMATPHVAGVAALLLANRPSLSVAEVKDSLLNGVDRLAQWNGLVASGGRLNAYLTFGTAPSPAPGNSSPSVTLTNPLQGQAFLAPVTLTMTASAFDADGTVTRVDFYAGTSFVGSDIEAPYVAIWNEANAGTYTLRAVAYDDGGASASHEVTVSVVGTAPPPAAGNSSPSVTLTNPLQGQVFLAPVTLTMTASASDADGTVMRVDFYAGAHLVESDTEAPYMAIWNEANEGTYTLSAVAYDNGGGSASHEVTVSVVRSAPPPESTVGRAALGNLATPAPVRVRVRRR